VATSSGNTGSALAAYCARYGLPCAIVVNQHAPAGKLAQMKAHGALVIRVEDFLTAPELTSEVLGILSRLSQEESAGLVVSAYRYCPEGMAGVEAIGRELQEQCDGAPPHVFVPVGGGGLFSAVCRGLAGTVSRVHAVQPEGCLTVVASWERGDSEIRPVRSTTRISGLAVPFDIDAGLALDCLRRCEGLGIAVGDDEVFEAQRLMLEEGIYCEPAGATALAGLRRALGEGKIGREAMAVCLVTGHGFKDPDSVASAAQRHPDTLLRASELQAYLRQTVLKHEPAR
jgi:threonine synthase